jgi:transposase
MLEAYERPRSRRSTAARPMLPMRPGQPARRSHDYTRHGTTSLFAALDIASGRVIGKFYGRHRAAGFRKFLDEIEAAVPDNLDMHLVMDSYATHKTPLIRKWLAKRPRWHMQLTPTSASWFNQFERFFALLTDKKDQTRHLPERGRAQARYRFLHSPPQCRFQALHVDKIRRRYPRLNRTLLSIQCPCRSLKMSRASGSGHQRNVRLPTWQIASRAARSRLILYRRTAKSYGTLCVTPALNRLERDEDV